MYRQRVVADGISAFLSLSADYLGLADTEPGSRTSADLGSQPTRRLTSTSALSYPLGERHRCAGRNNGWREVSPDLR